MAKELQAEGCRPVMFRAGHPMWVMPDGLVFLWFGKSHESLMQYAMEYITQRAWEYWYGKV